jgi:NAD dependent epimerase/dehydratase family enzyme
MQEADASGVKMRQGVIDKARRQAETEVSGAAAGVGGTALDSLVDDIGRRAEDNRMAVMDNWNATVTQLQNEKLGVIAKGTTRVNSLARGQEPVAPSFAGTAFTLAGAGLRYFADTTKAETA